MAKMTHTLPQFIAGIQKRAALLRSLGVLPSGQSFSEYKPSKAGNPTGIGSKKSAFRYGYHSRGAKTEEAEPKVSLKALETFTEPEE